MFSRNSWGVPLLQIQNNIIAMLVILNILNKIFFLLSMGLDFNIFSVLVTIKKLFEANKLVVKRFVYFHILDYHI